MPKAKWEVRCDFNKNGVFTDANEDISADVQRLLITRGKNINAQRAEAGVLDMIVRNDSHKYSPTKTTSVLYPNVNPGPYVWVKAAYPLDTFTGIGVGSLTGRKPDYDDQFAAWAGDTTLFIGDGSNQMKSTADSVGQKATLDFGESDCAVGVKFTRGNVGAGFRTGLVIRWIDASNYISIGPEGGDLAVYKVDAGVVSAITSAAFVWALSATKFLAVDLHGSSIYVYVDDVLQISTSSTFNQTATKHGIGGIQVSIGDRWDDFGGWRSMFYGRIDTVEPRPERGRQYAYIRCFDEMERARRYQVYRTAPVAPVTAKALINEVLDAVSASTPNRILDTGQTLTKLTAHRKSLGRDGLTELYQIQDDDVGFFYIDGAGIARYEDTDHRIAGAHTAVVSQWLASASLSSQPYFSSLSWDDGKSVVENEGYFLYHKISATTVVTVWTLNESTDLLKDKPKILLGSGQSFLAVGDADNISNPIAPVHATDFKFNTLEDGAGTDLLASVGNNIGTVTTTGSALYQLDDTGQNFTSAHVNQRSWVDGKHEIEITDVGGKLARAFIGTEDPDGDGTRIVLYTDDTLVTKGYIHKDSAFVETGSTYTYKIFEVSCHLVVGWEGNFRLVKVYNDTLLSDGFLTFMRLRADRGTKSNKAGARYEDSTSQTNVGRRRIQHETLHIDRYGDLTDKGSAIDRVTARIKARSLPQARLKLLMHNSNKASLMQILHRSISDRVRVTYTPMGIDDQFFIERQSVQVTEGASHTECNWELQRSNTGGWGYVRWGFFQWA